MNESGSFGEFFDGLFERHRAKTRFAGAKNPVVKHAAAILGNKKPNPRRLMAVEGIWAFNMARQAGLRVINLLIAPECVYSPEGRELAAYFADAAEDVNVLSKKVFLTLSERDEPDGLMAVCEPPRFDLKDAAAAAKDGDALIVVLDGLEIPGNIGTILRSCDAVRADAVFVCDRKARLSHPKLIKGSMGALFFVPVIEFDTAESCRDWLNDNHFGVYLTDTRAERGFHEYDYNGNTAVVMGSERYGINRVWYDGDVNLMSIPMMGRCDSLNVAIATTVVLYEARLKKDGMR